MKNKKIKYQLHILMPLGPIFLSLAHFATIPIILKSVSEQSYGYLGAILGIYNILVYIAAFNASGKLAILVTNKKFFQVKKFELVVMRIYLKFLILFLLLSILLLFSNEFNLNFIDIFILCFLAYLQNINLLRITRFQFEKKYLIYLLYFFLVGILSIFFTACLSFYYQLGVSGRLASMLFSTLIGSILLFRKDFNTHNFITKKKINWVSKVWFDYSIPLFPHMLASVLFINMDRIILVSSSLSDSLGRYYLATQLAAPLLIIANALNVYMRVRIYENLSNGIEFRFDLVSMLYVLAMLLFSFLILVFAYWLQNYTNLLSGFIVIDLMLILVLGHILQSVYFLYSNKFLYHERGDLISKASIIGVFFHLIFALVILNYFSNITLYPLAYVFSSLMFVILLMHFNKSLNNYVKTS